MHTTAEIKITPAQRAAEKRARLQEMRKMAFIDAIIRNEKLNLKGHEKGWQTKYMSNMTAGKAAAAYSAPIFEYGDKWARLMQVEMKRTNPPKLTPEIVKQTEDALGEFAMRARGLVVATWIHGAELGRILGWSESDIQELRHNFSNTVVMSDYRQKQRHEKGQRCRE